MRNCFTKFTNVFRKKNFDNEFQNDGGGGRENNIPTTITTNTIMNTSTTTTITNRNNSFGQTTQSSFLSGPSTSSSSNIFTTSTSTITPKKKNKKQQQKQQKHQQQQLLNIDKKYYENADYQIDIFGRAENDDVVGGGSSAGIRGRFTKISSAGISNEKSTATTTITRMENIDKKVLGTSESLVDHHHHEEEKNKNSLQRKSGKKYGNKKLGKDKQKDSNAMQQVVSQQQQKQKLVNDNVDNDEQKVTELFFDSGYDDNPALVAKTPEELEYEESIAAESKDVMTPLPSSSKHYNFGRNVQPEFVDLIRNLDSDALRINNITMEDKIELIRRFDVGQNSRRHSRPKSHKHRSKTLDGGSGGYDSDEQSSESGVILRRTQMVCEDTVIGGRPSYSLYERRQPKGPKLKLLVKFPSHHSAANSNANANNNDDENDDHERNLMDQKYPTLLPPNPQLKALLIFPKTDNIFEVVKSACHRHQFEATQVKSMETAIEHLNKSTNASECYHLIVIDARSPKALDAEHLTRSIRHTSGHHFTTIVAVVKKNFFDKDDALIALLDAGVNRCMAETTNVTACGIEIKQILHSIVRPHNVMATQQALYTALHRLKEVLIITDDVHRIQYANKSAERLLNMRLDEIISRPLAEIFVSDVSSINSHAKSVKEFDGILTVKRKNQEGIPMHVRVVPVACIGNTPTHFIFNFDLPVGQTDFIATLPQPKEAPRGSLHSVRRGSFDVRSIASDGLRRTSLAKLTSLPLEAPITKIINLLSQVQENSASEEARIIDRVMEFLKREGLYSPQMKEIRTEDPIATDLIGALLTNPVVYSSRRSSNDSIIRTSAGRGTTIVPSKMKSNAAIMELLEESLSWDFDIFRLEEITEYRPLLYLGMELFRKFDVFATLNVEECVCKNWLAVMEDNYHKENSYHNSTHAADVAQAASVFLSQLATKEMGLDRMDEATILIAAIAHDVDHPGRSSAFLSNSNNPLAILYNDLTVLESHHAAFTFKLTLSDEKVNIFKNLDRDAYKSARSVIIDMILATEMTRHFEHLAKFVSVFGTDMDPKEAVFSDEESSILMRRMLIKVADVSNPARPSMYCVEWARRIAEEYFTQTDEEKEKLLPIVMPMFDRSTCSIPKSQIGFLEYIVQDMIHAWDCFIEMPELISCMQANFAEWKKFEEQGIKTLADIKAKVPLIHQKKSTNK